MLRGAIPSSSGSMKTLSKGKRTKDQRWLVGEERNSVALQRHEKDLKFVGLYTVVDCKG